jgi:hypothetical protein
VSAARGFLHVTISYASARNPSTTRPFTTPDPLLETRLTFIARREASKDRNRRNWSAARTVPLSQTSDVARYRRHAAFNLHQAAEAAYACFLLTSTFYFPRSHNIKFLRSLTEDKEPRLIEAWPRAGKADRRRFELLKRAYVEARYSANYNISIEDLDALYTCVKRLRDLVEQQCQERIRRLQRESS